LSGLLLKPIVARLAATEVVAFPKKAGVGRGGVPQSQDRTTRIRPVSHKTDDRRHQRLRQNLGLYPKAGISSLRSRLSRWVLLFAFETPIGPLRCESWYRKMKFLSERRVCRPSSNVGDHLASNRLLHVNELNACEY